jgi:2-keto-3-deoxy-L-rhamnonate aldolase RhmA
MLNPGQSDLPSDLRDVTALFVDREDTGLGALATHALIAKAALNGLVSVVRTNGLSETELTFCRDAGPDGLVLPQIASADELVAALGVLGGSAPQVIAQIETEGAVLGLDDLLGVPGICGFLIGPNDLAEAMGYVGQPTHPKVRATVERVAARLHSTGKPFGLPMLDSAAEDFWNARGALIQYQPINAFFKLGEDQ